MDFMKMLDKACGEELLQRHVDMDQANKEKRYYCSKVECEICHCDFKDQKYLTDCELKDQPGAWSLMCAECYSKHGGGIGYGVGQLYMKQDNGKWLKVGGFAPADCQ